MHDGSIHTLREVGESFELKYSLPPADRRTGTHNR
jgi:hypothetical protein